MGRLCKVKNSLKLFFSSVPGIISRHIKDNWQCILKNFNSADKQMQTMFEEKNNFKEFLTLQRRPICCTHTKPVL